MNLKKVTSLTMLLTMVVMTFTGIILFIAPPGRVANWSNWQIIGLNKEQYASIHSTFMVLFIVATILHLYYNWKPIISYMKNKTKELVIFTFDMIIAVFITFVFLVGTLYEITPFKDFLNIGDFIKKSWEKSYGTAPYSHAELSSLVSFSKKMGYDIEKVEKVLSLNNIKYTLSQSLLQIAKENKISSQKLYNLLNKKLAGDRKIVPLSGMGKKSVKEVAQTLGLTSKEFKLKLKSLGINNIDENRRFKELLEEYNMSPMDTLKNLGYAKPN